MTLADSIIARRPCSTACHRSRGTQPKNHRLPQTEIVVYCAHMKLAIEYTTQIWREGDQFIAHTMPLDVASSGGSPKEARQALDEAVHLFLRTAAGQGTLDQVLEDSGYVHTGQSWQSPSWLSMERGEAVLTV